MIEIGTFVTYRGRLHVVIGVSPIGVTPHVVEIEDSESGRVRRVSPADLRDVGVATSRRDEERDERET